ncbi:hypothetical protein V9L05_18740 [Bernardetia sp. Wsw4-3y2]|uniref:hypothetical protein n=1 Tax=Bernardetia sp. Wsw4-3y2 TaxID=3127471 RepID=UPI0030CB1385
MAGFLEDIHGDGSFGSDWQHRDVGNCKQYTTTDCDLITDFIPQNIDKAETWFVMSEGVFLLSNRNQNGGSNANGHFSLICGTGMQVEYSTDSVNKLYFRSANFPVTTKRNIFTIRKREGVGANCVDFFVNGIIIELPYSFFILPTTNKVNRTVNDPMYINRYNVNNNPKDGQNTNIAKMSCVNYAQSDLEIVRDAANEKQTANNPNQFLLNVDFNKSTGDNLTDISPNNYTITSVGNKNFANFYS